MLRVESKLWLCSVSSNVVEKVASCIDSVFEDNLTYQLC